VPGCTCLKHTPAPKRKCPEGCTCGKHNKQRRINWDDPEVRKTYNREMARKIRAANPARSREATQRWQERNPDHRLAYKYNLTLKKWRSMLEEQNNRCYLCQRQFGEGKANVPHVDHDHACCSGERTCGQCIRGLACDNCNWGIGRFNDDPALMRRVADALEAAQAKLKR
jgi:hypothetical protein